jgi:hypothetical protein
MTAPAAVAPETPVVRIDLVPDGARPDQGSTMVGADGKELLRADKQTVADLPGGPPPSIADAVRAARERMAKGEPIVDLPVADEPGTGETPDDAAEGEADAEEGAEEEAPPVDAKTNPLYFAGPPLTPNGAPIEMILADEDSLKSLQMLQSGYARGEQARAVEAESRAIIDEFNEFTDAMQLDPVDVVERSLSIEQGEILARTLLTHPEILKRLVEGGLREALDDETAFGSFKLRAENERSKLRDSARAKVETTRAVRKNAGDIMGALGRLMPPDLTPEQRDLFLRDARGDIRAFQQERRVEIVDPRDVPGILAPRMKAYGLERPAGKGKSGAPAATETAAAPSPAPPRVAAAPRTPEAVKTAAGVRRVLAAAAPGTSGAPHRKSPLDLIPAGSNIKQAAAAFRTARRAGTAR